MVEALCRYRSCAAFLIPVQLLFPMIELQSPALPVDEPDPDTHEWMVTLGSVTGPKPISPIMQPNPEVSG
jgi:hypothetical protein